MKNIILSIILLFSMLSVSQESAVEEQVDKSRYPKRKSYLQGQREDPTSKLFGTKDPTVEISNLPKLSPEQQADINKEVAQQKELEKKANEAKYQISKEKEAEIKLIISQKTKINQLKIEEAQSKVFINKAIKYSIIIIVLLVSIFIIAKILKSITFDKLKSFINKFTVNLKNKLSKLNRDEVYLTSFSIGLVFSIITGNLFPILNYYRLSKQQGQAIKVSERLSTYSIESFNYSIAILSFILVSISIYFLLKKSNEH